MMDRLFNKFRQCADVQAALDLLLLESLERS
jgi:hypothetical protein